MIFDIYMKNICTNEQNCIKRKRYFLYVDMSRILWYNFYFIEDTLSDLPMESKIFS